MGRLSDERCAAAAAALRYKMQDARGRRCMKEVLLLRQGDREGEGGGSILRHNNDVSIQENKPGMQDAAEERMLKSTPSLVPDRAQDYRCFAWRKEWIQECMDG